jgi:hypothetical protein
MTLSLIGLMVCAVLLGLGRLLGAPLLVGTVASVAFGSTAVATLDAAGGSSPLIYVVFAVLVCASAAASPAFGRNLSLVFVRSWEPWIVGALAVYAVGTAIILPRLFAGATSAFVTVRGIGVVEVSLQPSSGNLTQTGYFALGALTFLSLSSMLARGHRLPALRSGFRAWAALVAVGGLIDLAGKMAGLGDVLAPIRTATFAYLTDSEQAGFWRIAGSYSEASAFGAAALAALAFSFTDWRQGGSRLSGSVAALLLVLLVLSTSTTAYAGLAVLGALMVTSIARSALTGRLTAIDLLLVAGLLAGAATLICLALYDHRLLEPFQNLLQSTLIDKSSSESARERGYWNERSIMTLFDTWGLGQGFGSSRSSNWLVSVVSQTGLIGTLLQLGLVASVLRPWAAPGTQAAREPAALHASLRACAFAILLGALIAGGSADPGLLFFIAMAGMIGCRGLSAPRANAPPSAMLSRGHGMAAAAGER